MLSSSDHQQNLVESVYAWWRDAGVEFVCEDRVINWLEPLQGAGKDEKSNPVAPIMADAPNAIAAAPVAPPPVATELWPSDLASLKAAIAQGVPLPGCGYGPRAIAPDGEKGADVFIIVDCPEEEEIAEGHYGEGKTAVLLKNMLLAAKILPDFTYRTALAHSRSAVNSVPKSDLPILAAFVQHQIALVEPKRILLLGTAACEAMLGQDMMQARGDLHYFKVNDRNMAAVATFHPRTLIAQPRMKAQAWQDLQMLAREDCP